VLEQGIVAGMAVAGLILAEGKSTSVVGVGKGIRGAGSCS